MARFKTAALLATDLKAREKESLDLPGIADSAPARDLRFSCLRRGERVPPFHEH